VTRRLTTQKAGSGSGGFVPLRVRRYRPSDFEALVELQREARPDGWGPETLVYFLSRRRTRTYVAELGGQVLGFFMVSVGRDRLHLDNVSVGRDARRRGIGLALLAMVDRLAVARGVAQIDLEVREHNLRAQLLYRRAGYRAHEVLSGHYRGEDGYAMRRYLFSNDPWTEAAEGRSAPA
jgi:ribosomal-protein-alanine N-acetyltransferase